MSRSLQTALVLMLISGGGFLIYQGLHEYYGAEESQREAAREWNQVKVQEPTSPVPPENNEALHRGPEVQRPTIPAYIPEGTIFSRLEVPRLDKSLYVVEGDNSSSLSKGPGHVRGTAMPGQDGNCVIAGHRDLHFRFLKDIEPGDKVFVETAQGKYCYRVTGTKIISPTQIQVLQPTPDPELHLITCYPFYFLGHAPKRFVVTAELDMPTTELTSNHGTSDPKLDLSKKLASKRAVAEKSAKARTKKRRVSFASSRSELEPSEYERSLQLTRDLNRAAAGDL